MKTSYGAIAAALLALATMLGSGVGQAQQEQGAGKKAGEKLDEAAQAIKKGLQNARDTVREQFAKTRESIHNMGIESRVYGRLHWDKALTSSSLEIEVKNDVATLRGSVPDAKAKAKAVELAENTVGITKVIDQLTILPPPRTVPDTSAETTPKP
jgi:hyperosmotically inducible periplasmic protein